MSESAPAPVKVLVIDDSNTIRRSAEIFLRQGGHEVVLAADGTATGELREFEAFAPILALGGEAHLYLGISTGEDPLPWPTAEQFEQDIAKLRRGLGHCARHGITSAVNMDGNLYTLSLLEEAQSRDAL